MAITPITQEQIGTGKPTSQELFQKMKDGLEDLDGRVTGLSNAVLSSAPIDFNVLGVLVPPMAVTGILHYRLNRNVRVVGARLFVVTASTTGGIVEVDLQYKREPAGWISLLTSTISASYTLGSLKTVTGSIALAHADLIPGDIIRLNVISVQTNMRDFSVYLEVEPR